MQETDFYRLFAETGEPMYWLLSRCGEKSAPRSVPITEDAPAEKAAPLRRAVQ